MLPGVSRAMQLISVMHRRPTSSYSARGKAAGLRCRWPSDANDGLGRAGLVLGRLRLQTLRQLNVIVDVSTYTRCILCVHRMLGELKEVSQNKKPSLCHERELPSPGRSVVKSEDYGPIISVCSVIKTFHCAFNVCLAIHNTIILFTSQAFYGIKRNYRTRDFGWLMAKIMSEQTTDLCVRDLFSTKSSDQTVVNDYVLLLQS